LRAGRENPYNHFSHQALTAHQPCNGSAANYNDGGLMPRSRMRVDHKVPITSPQMFSNPYAEIPIDKDDPRENLELTF
jgi:hypothetical protein